MKKILCILICIAMCAVMLQGCGNKDEKIEEEQQVNTVEEDEDGFKKYIASLEPDAKSSFPMFWMNMVNFCKGAEFKLEKYENQGKYEFDPSKEEEIPKELAEWINFDEIKLYTSFELHNDYKMIVDGTKVELSFDGQPIYPTNYGYLEITELAAE